MKQFYPFVLPLLMMSPDNVFGQQLPDFESGILTLPAVSTAKNGVQYESVQFKLAKDGRWDLVSFTESQQAVVESINISLVESFPVQALVNIQGFLPNGCYSLGQHYINRKAEQFDVTITMVSLQTLDLVACTQAIEPFKITLPLDIYGLDAGQYQVIVNGIKDSFKLSVSNVIEKNQ